jgi:hypothetical protein
MTGDQDRPSEWPVDAAWPPEDVWLTDDELPPLVATGPQPPPSVRTATWCATLLGPLVLWAIGFWLAGLGQPDVRPDGCSGLCLSARQETWFAGLAYGVVAVPIGTLVGAVVVALTVPIRRVSAANGVLLVDGLVVLLAAGTLAGP